MIVLDASVLIAYFDSDDAHHAAAVTLLDQHVDSPWTASALTVAELLVGPARRGTAALRRAEHALAELGVTAQPLAPSEAGALAILRADTRLRLPDCCVLHTAELLGARVATYDDQLAAAAAERGCEVLG